MLALFADHLATAVVSCDSPRFLAFIPAAPTKAALLFDMIVSCSSLQGTSWLEAAGAVAAENQVLEFLAAPGRPARRGGRVLRVRRVDRQPLRAGGGARHRRGPPAGGAAPRPRIAVSEEAHASVAKALRILSVEPFVVPAVGPSPHRGRRCAAALDGDDDPDDVIGVVATAGTTNAGIVDDLAGIAEVATRARPVVPRRRRLRRSRGCSRPLVRDRYAGIEKADSFVIDPHKWLYAPFDCAALVYRQPALAKAVHSQEASYLDVIHDDDNPVWNPSDYAIHLTRRARGLPLWFSLAVHGAGAYRDAVETVLRTAWRAPSSSSASPHLELVREPELSIVLFRRRGWGPADDYEVGRCDLLAQQIGFVTPTSWEGETVARLAFLHPGTTVAMIEEIVATMA